MRYKCLILDHDDTVVSSTAQIHFPSFVEYLKITRPEIASKWTLEEYLIKNCHPGITSILRDELGMDEAEVQRETDYWASFVENHTPTAYDGIGNVMARFRSNGGIIAVASHSLLRYIERDYRYNNLPTPDVIYSWDMPEEQRKPTPYAPLDLMKRFSLSPSEILVVDDLKPGYDMARGAGVDFAAAGWAYNIPEIESFMRENCDYYLNSVENLRELLF